MQYVLKDASGKVTAFGGYKFHANCEETAEQYDVGFDGKIYSATEMQGEAYARKRAECEQAEALAGLRARREQECFMVVNRGALWYDKLTDEQKEELSSWYEEWLNAPETGIIPSKPTWIDSVTKRRPS